MDISESSSRTFPENKAHKGSNDMQDRHEAGDCMVLNVAEERRTLTRGSIRDLSGIESLALAAEPALLHEPSHQLLLK